MISDSTKTIRLLALDFYAVIVDSGFAAHQLLEVPISSLSDVKKTLPDIMSLNSRSLRNKVDELSARANQTISNIICVTETWLTDDLPDEAVELNGYSIVSKDRVDYNNAGAVCIYIYVYKEHYSL